MSGIRRVIYELPTGERHEVTLDENSCLPPPGAVLTIRAGEFGEQRVRIHGIRSTDRPYERVVSVAPISQPR